MHPTDLTDQHTDQHARTGPDVLDVLVVGAGQAGLAISYHLRRSGLRFLVVDAAPQVGSAWRARWDSLTLFTPAQYDALPGMAFPAPDDTHPTAAQVADYLESYAVRFELPLQLGTRITRLVRDGDVFTASTPGGDLRARQVVVATGPFQAPVVPAVGAGLDGDVRQLHSAEYRNAAQVGDGPVLVVGSGNSGRQIALELATTHDVALATGSPALQLPQRVLGRDLFWWLTRLGVLTKTPDSLLARRMRARGDLVIGSPLAALRTAGVEVRPRVTAARGGRVRFADGSDLEPATVVWATGFRPDYSWIEIDGVTDGGGVVHQRGVSAVHGLSFLGLPWQHTRGSALLGFVQEDAAWLAERITAAAASPAGH